MACGARERGDRGEFGVSGEGSDALEEDVLLLPKTKSRFGMDTRVFKRGLGGP